MPNIVRIRSLVKESNFSVISGVTFPVDHQNYDQNAKRLDMADLKKYILSGFTGGGGTNGTSGTDGQSGIPGIDGTDGTSGTDGDSPCIELISNSIRIVIVAATTTTTTTPAATTTTTTTSATTTTTTTESTTTTTTTEATTTTTTTEATTTTTTTEATTTTTTTEATTTTTTTTEATTTTTTTPDPYNYYNVKIYDCSACGVLEGSEDIKTTTTCADLEYWYSVTTAKTFYVQTTASVNSNLRVLAGNSSGHGNCADACNYK